MLRALKIAGVFLTLGLSSAFAENALFIQSKTVGVGASATVGVFMANDESIRQITIPLVVREVTPGVYPTALSASYTPDGRIPVPGPYLNGTSFLYYYDVEDGTCKNGQPGGFGTISGSGALVASYSVPSPSNPDGFNFSRGIILSGSLPAGTDGVTPSMAFGFTAPMAEGSFEIDSTCRNPGGHLLFVAAAGGGGILPSFTKGVVDVAPCACPGQGDADYSGEFGVLDFGWIVAILFEGAPDPHDPFCPATRSDLDCDGFTTAVDLGWMIDYFWAGGPPPCNPCSDL